MGCRYKLQDNKTKTSQNRATTSRYHPYASSSNRNCGETSRNTELHERCIPAEKEDEEKKKIIMEKVDNMSLEQLRDKVKEAAHVIPDHLFPFFDSESSSTLPRPSWCSCGNCEIM
ncbi:hypothetical protein LOTGIDRAFT_158259 [Lottia gigantea]|nr:hypothetical protein LOTGIDRAFT_158259 [Lottia gigantea]ESP00032.1 hypothetical protein LOTGIDRAFT_158259 [Lottia gigantea]